MLPFYAPEKIWRFYTPVAHYLSRETSITWKLKLYYDYDSVINGICSNEISLAYLGPISFGIAYEKCKPHPLAVSLGSDGKPFYRSIIFTNDFHLNSVKELKGKTFAFGDGDSTSSNAVPKKMLAEEGVSLGSISPLFFKSHEKVVDAVVSNRAVAGATKLSVFEMVKGLRLKALKASQPLPHHTFCSAPGTPLSIEKKIAAALLKLKPRRNSADKITVSEWDPDLRYGLTAPPYDYVSETKKMLEIHTRYR
ncbi:MAG TPA: PhnD/SsuA/transferrin family substrate-binding protein [Dissulfurispiraceae bacterium]